MEKKQGYIKNLDEKIYFICFAKPSCPTDITESLYGLDSKKSNTCYSKIIVKTNKLSSGKNPWLEYLPDFKSKAKQGEKDDKRSNRRKYYDAKPTPLIKKIEEKIELTDFDRYILQNLFNSKRFRELVYNSPQVFDLILKNDFISPLEYILVQLEHWVIIYSKNKYQRTIGSKIKTKEIYDFLTTNYRKAVEKQDLDRYKEKIRKIIPSEYEEMSKLKTTTDLLDKLHGVEHLIFIPTDLIEKIKGVSFFGLLDEIFTSINQEVIYQSNLVRTAWPNLSKKIDNGQF